MPGDEPPEEVKMLDQWGQQWVKIDYGSPEYVELAQKIFDFQAKNLVIIGVVGMTPVPLIAKRNLGNIPTSFTTGMEVRPVSTYTAISSSSGNRTPRPGAEE